MICPRVLVVEDDAIVADDIAETLLAMGCEIAGIAHSAREAVSLARDGDPELALLDIRLPDEHDGIDVGRVIGAELGIPVVYLTAHADGDTLERAKETAPFGYVLKPYDAAEIRTAVEIAMHRHRLETRLRESEERFAATLRSIGDAVVVTNPVGQVTFMNRHAEELTGWRVDEATGRDVADVVVLRNARTDYAIASPARRALRERRSVDVDGEIRLVSRDGRSRLVTETATPVESDDDVLMGSVIVLRDVTESREMAKALRRSEERYSRMFRLSPVAIATLSAEDGRIAEANESFLRLVSARRSEVLGRPLRKLDIWADASTADALVEEIVEHRVVDGREVGIRPGDGELRHVVVSAEALRFGEENRILALFHDITERKSAEEELERLALYDPLTGLPNRRLFRDRLGHAVERARRGSGKVAVLYLDLDRFKVVNDTLGHAAGDELLTRVAERLRRCFREEDTVARLGGDEFAAVLEGVEGRAEIRRVTDRITEALDEPFEVEGTRVDISASAGIAVSADDESDPEDLLRYSDVAMYRAKSSERSSFRFFDAGPDADETRRLHRENALRSAIEGDGLRLLYQPLVELKTGRVVGCEALVRRHEPGRGLVPPEEFIPLAEETGLIIPLGEWVLRNACAHADRWRREGRVPDDFIVSVNLSSRQFEDPELPERVRGALEVTGTAPEAVQLEVTETAVMRSRERLEPLRAIGVRVALDDFGTGYSSLGYLQELEVDALKIDGTFVAGLGRRSEDGLIVETILRFARGLGLRAVAEGIETEDQLDHLRELGCGCGQGFLFSELLSPDAVGDRVGGGGSPHLAGAPRSP